jgi:hypothetical protein
LRRFSSFRHLRRQDQLLLLQALCLVAVIRAGLTVLSLPRIVHLTQRPLPLGPGRITPQRVQWAVTTASRYVPGAACLTQALAAQALLTSAGLQADLRIGVAKEGQSLAAHAWLEREGALIFGDSQPEYFTPLPHLPIRPRVPDGNEINGDGIGLA